MSPSTAFSNARVCRDGKLVRENFTWSLDTGLFVESTGDRGSNSRVNTIDLQGKIVAPGFIELQTNGMRGFHFTHFENENEYQHKLDEVARYLPSQGVTGLYVTIPTVASHDFKRILPSLRPRDIVNGASLLGAHAEGPYLFPSKKGAHNSSLFYNPDTPPIDVYGPTAASPETLKLVTLAPELPDSSDLITSLTTKGIKVSLGHSNATYDQGLTALQSGATCLTHTLNAMSPIHHRDPGIAGLITSSQAPYYSLIPDGNHLHPSIVTMLFRSNPSKCILITDSIELAGHEDGTYPAHAQVPHRQTKKGSRVVIEGTETLA